MSTLPDGSLGEKVRLWTLTVDRDSVLLPLAHGHVYNWLDASDTWWIPERFRFVKAALCLVS